MHVYMYARLCVRRVCICVMTEAGHTRSVQAVQHAQDDVQGLHQVHSVAAGLVRKGEVLQQPPHHRQQARLLHVIMQKPAEANLSPPQA